MAEENGNRALVVEDDDSIRMMLARIVEHLDFEVDTARDGVEAIEKLDHDRYRLVLLDLMMPHIDGYEVLRHMHDHHLGVLGCTIVASAVPESEILKNFDVPVYRIRGKPFDVDALMADIRACHA